MEFLSKNRIMRSCISGFEDGDVIELGFSEKDILSRSDVYDANCRSRGKMNRFELDGATKRDSYMRATAASFACGLPNFIEEKLDIRTIPAFILEAVEDGGKVCNANFIMSHLLCR